MKADIIIKNAKIRYKDIDFFIKIPPNTQKKMSRLFIFLKALLIFIVIHDC